MEWRWRWGAIIKPSRLIGHLRHYFTFNCFYCYRHHTHTNTHRHISIQNRIIKFIIFYISVCCAWLYLNNLIKNIFQIIIHSLFLILLNFSENVKTSGDSDTLPAMVLVLLMMLVLVLVPRNQRSARAIGNHRISYHIHSIEKYLRYTIANTNEKTLCRIVIEANKTFRGCCGKARGEYLGGIFTF